MKKGSLTFPFSSSATPSVFENQEYRNFWRTLEFLLELNVKGETLLLLRSQRSIKVLTLSVFSQRKFLSLSRWKFGLLTFTPTTSTIQGSIMIKRKKGIELQPLCFGLLTLWHKPNEWQRGKKKKKSCLSPNYSSSRTYHRNRVCFNILAFSEKISVAKWTPSSTFRLLA